MGQGITALPFQGGSSSLFNHSYFLLEDKLYVIMELVEGAPLGEHFNSLKEKGTRFSEERIWHIFIQVQ